MNELCKSWFQQVFLSLVLLRVRNKVLLVSFWLLEWSIVIISNTQWQNLSQWGKVLDWGRGRRDEWWGERREEAQMPNTCICLSDSLLSLVSLSVYLTSSAHIYSHTTNFWNVLINMGNFKFYIYFYLYFFIYIVCTFLLSSRPTVQLLLNISTWVPTDCLNSVICP